MMIPFESLNSLDQSATMSSREIAALTGITHGEVKRIVKSLETAQRLSEPVRVAMFERDGESYQEFLLNKRDSLLAVARLSPGFTAAVLDRWQERENKTALPDFTNPPARGLNSTSSAREPSSSWLSPSQRRSFLTASLRCRTRWVFASSARC